MRCPFGQGRVGRVLEGGRGDVPDTWGVANKRHNGERGIRMETNGSTTTIITDQAGMPNVKEAERAVLGAMLIDNSIIPDVTVTLSASSFHNKKNRTAYNAIRDAWENEGVADQVTVTMHLRDAGKLDDVGQSYVAELAGETATSANWKAYARIVTDHQNRRNMIVLAQKCETLARAGDIENGLAVMRDYLDKATIETTETDWQDMPTVGEFVKSGDETIDFLLAGAIIENSTTILASDPGAGKSMWAMGLSFSIATGKPFVGREVKPGKVLCFDYEMAENLLRWRLGAVARGMGLDIDKVDSFRIRSLATDELSTEAGINKLAAKIAAFKPSLVVFDTMRRVMGDLKENQSDDMAKILLAINHIKARTGHDFSVLYLHHTVKDKEAQGLEKVRGSGDLAGQVDQVLVMDSFSDGKITLDAVKQRHGEPFKETYRMLWTQTDVRFEQATHAEAKNNGKAKTEPQTEYKDGF